MKVIESIKRHPWKSVLIFIIIVASGYAFYAHRDSLNRDDIIAYGKGLSAPVLIAAFFILPLFGGPVSLLLILVGIRFGIGWGMLVATIGMLFHHAVAFWIAHGFLREKISRFAKKRGQKIPSIEKGNQVWYTVLFAAVHGPPYALKLYLLALTDVPFAIYILVGAPVYILFSIVPVGGAAAAIHFDMTWVYVMVAVASLSVILVKYLKKKKEAAG